MSDDPASSVPIPLAAFGALLKPQQIGNTAVHSRKPGAMPQNIALYGPGHPDEIWLKMLEIKHKIERRTVEEWHALIAKYKQDPAHPADPNYIPGS